MKQLRKSWPVFLAFALCTAVCLLFCSRKQGMFIDEIYSYGLANSAYAPFLSDLKDGNLIDEIFTQEEINGYLTVGAKDAFSLGSVYYNQTRDVHPPLYYWALHLASSLVQGSCSVLIGLGVNLLFYLLTLLALYKLSRQLFESRKIAAAVVMLYGMSVIGTSTAMMLRMYMLLTLFTVLLALIAAKILQYPEQKRNYLLLTVIMAGGLLTQYYFVFYAFFLCAAVVLYSMARKRFRSAALFSVCALVGVGLLFVLFPASWKHLFVGNGEVVGGASILDMLRDTASYETHIDKFREAELKMKAIRWVFSAGCICVVLSYLRCALIGTKLRLDLEPLVVLLPAFPAFLFVAIISPVQEQRYIYNLIPILVLDVGFVLRISDRSLENVRPAEWIRTGAVLLIAASALWSAKRMPPANLFPAMQEYDAHIAEHCDAPCVYYTDGYFSPLTQDLLQLKQFDDFLVINSTASPALEDYTGDSESIVLFIDTGAFWSSGFDAETVLNDFAQHTPYTAAELLYEYDFEGSGGLSATYVLTRNGEAGIS